MQPNGQRLKLKKNEIKKITNQKMENKNLAKVSPNSHTLHKCFTQKEKQKITRVCMSLFERLLL